MATQKRQRREYLRFLDAAKQAGECAIDNFNRAKGPFRTEATLILLSTAWELLAKACLVQMRESIRKGQRGDTITAEVAVSRLLAKKALEKHESDVVQQVISLRNAAIHDVLPKLPVEVQHHLLYYATKFFRAVIERRFKNHSKDLEQHYLTLSFSDMTTYADKVQKCVAKINRSQSDKKLVWLLERGVAFDGSQYMTEAQFDAKLKGKPRKLTYLEIGSYMKTADMVRFVPVEAPRNYTADVSLRKGSANDSTLPVVVKKTEMETDYPYLTSELAEKVGKDTNFVARAASVLGLKGNAKFHQSIRTSAATTVQRYSESAKAKIENLLAEDPAFNPYAAAKK